MTTGTETATAMMSMPPPLSLDSEVDTPLLVALTDSTSSPPIESPCNPVLRVEVAVVMSLSVALSPKLAEPLTTTDPVLMLLKVILSVRLTLKLKIVRILMTMVSTMASTSA